MVGTAVLLCLATFARPAAAQEDARTLFLRGAEAYQAGDYPTAVEAFEASYAQAPVPVVLFNLAQTLVALHRRAEAIDAFHRYLSTEESIDAERQAAVEQAMRELERELTPVRIEINVRGAEVRVDGRVLGESPFRETVYVDAGRRRFTATADGHVEASRSLMLRAGTQSTLSLRLEPIPVEGTLRLRANVHPAMVFLDDTELGRAPLDRTVRVGAHTVRVEANGYDDFEEAIRIEEDQRIDLRAVLEERSRVVDQWWLWAGLGGAVLLGVILAIGLTVPASVDPLEGSLPTVNALSVGR